MTFYLLPVYKDVEVFEKLLDEKGNEILDGSGKPLAGVTTLLYKFWLFWKWEVK